MIGALVAVAVVVVVAIATATTVLLAREPGRKVRPREVAAAAVAINAIDDVIDRYHPQLDVVGQAMADDVRTLISQYRKETVR